MESKQQRAQEFHPSYPEIVGLPKGLWALRRVDHPAIQLVYVDRNQKTAVNRVRNSKKRLQHKLTKQDSIVFLNDSDAKHNEQIQHYFSCIKLNYPELKKKTQDDILKLIPEANADEMKKIISAFTTLCKTKENVSPYSMIKQDGEEKKESVASSSKSLAGKSKKGTKRKDSPSNESNESKPKKQKKEHVLPVTFRNLRRVEDPAIAVVYIEGDQSMVADRFVEVRAILGLKLSKQQPVLFLNDTETHCTRDNYLSTHQERVSDFFNALISKCPEFKNHSQKSLLSLVPFASSTELKKVEEAFSKIMERMPKIFPSLLVAPQVVQAEEKPVVVDQSAEDYFLSTDSTLFGEDLSGNDAPSFVMDTSADSSSDMDSVSSNSSLTNNDELDHTKYSAWGNPHSFFLGEPRHSIPKLPSGELEEGSQNKIKF